MYPTTWMEANTCGANEGGERGETEGMGRAGRG